MRKALMLAAVSAALLAAPALSLGAAQEEALREIDALDAAVTQAWIKAPLTERRAMFVVNPVQTYGAWTARETNVFRPGEKLLTYVEPVGYVWRDGGGGWFSFGFTLDFKVKTPDGRILGGQDAFQRFEFKTQFKNREVFANLTMSLSGISDGDYVLVYTLRDIASDKVSSFEQPFKIAS